METITVCDWYRRRYWVLGMARVAHATAIQEQSADDFTNQMHNDIGAVQTALAVSTLADTGRTLEFFRRCDTGYSSEYRRARVELKELQTDRARREQLDRLSRPPGSDVESCFVQTDDKAGHSGKYWDRTEPKQGPVAHENKIDERTQEVTDNPETAEGSAAIHCGSAWEPYSPDHAFTEPAVQADPQSEPAAGGSEKIAERTEPTVVALSSPLHVLTPLSSLGPLAPAKPQPAYPSGAAARHFP